MMDCFMWWAIHTYRQDDRLVVGIFVLLHTFRGQDDGSLFVMCVLVFLVIVGYFQQLLELDVLFKQDAAMVVTGGGLCGYLGDARPVLVALTQPVRLARRQVAPADKTNQQGAL